MLKKFVLGLMVLPILMTSCKNDLDIIGEWNEVAIVYGLLDPADSINYIRVEKAFLGEGNALVMAQQHDSIYYGENLSVVLERRLNGQLMNTIIMERDTSVPKNPGVFATEGHVLYRTTQTILADSDYSLIVHNEQSGYTATAHTPIVDNLGFQAPLGGINWVINNNPVTVNVRWSTGPDTRIHQMVMRFNYKERNLNNGQEVSLHQDFQMGSVRSKNLTGGEVLSISIQGEQFFNLLTNRLTAPPFEIVRVAGLIEFIVTSGADEFATYLDVLNSSPGISQTTPTYSNINNGLGLLSSRTTQRHIRGMDSQSIDYLSCNAQTKHLKFLQNNQLPCPN